MSVLEQVQRAAAERQLRFVVIGGFAVIAHGYARFTGDIDLLILRDEVSQWRQLLQELGYQLIHDGDTFQQFRKPKDTEWPLDLMLVRPNTFEGLLAAARPTTIQGARVSLVSLEHLLALKLHVLKQARLHRFLKGFQDVVELIRANHLDLKSASLRDLFLRYGTADLYEKFQRVCAEF